MPTRYDIYGFRALSIEKALQLVQSALDVTLNRRDSEYRGLYYMTGRSQSRGLMLYANQTQDGWRRPEYKGYPVILTVSALEGVDEIQRKRTSDRTEPVLLSSTAHPDEPSDGELHDPTPP